MGTSKEGEGGVEDTNRQFSVSDIQIHCVDGDGQRCIILARKGTCNVVSAYAPPVQSVGQSHGARRDSRQTELWEELPWDRPEQQPRRNEVTTEGTSTAPEAQVEKGRVAWRHVGDGDASTPGFQPKGARFAPKGASPKSTGSVVPSGSMEQPQRFKSIPSSQQTSPRKAGGPAATRTRASRTSSEATTSSKESSASSSRGRKTTKKRKAS